MHAQLRPRRLPRLRHTITKSCAAAKIFLPLGDDVVFFDAMYFECSYGRWAGFSQAVVRESDDALTF